MVRMAIRTMVIPFVFVMPTVCLVSTFRTHQPHEITHACRNLDLPDHSPPAVNLESSRLQPTEGRGNPDALHRSLTLSPSLTIKGRSVPISLPDRKYRDIFEIERRRVMFYKM